MSLYVRITLFFIILLGLLSGCSTKNDAILEKKILTPESIEIYDISIDNFYSKPSSRARLLKNFPFISNEPILNFHGKFSNQFYDKLNYRYKSSPLKDVNFWKLRTNPFSQDFIYVLPIWIEKFQKVSNNLFENIAYSYNLSSKEQEILKWWIGQGGILWIEGGLYSTRYDTFNKRGAIDSKALNKKLITKSTHLTFFDTKVDTYVYKSKKIDFVNYTPLTLNYATASSIDYFKEIKKVKIRTKNFLSTDFLPKGEYLLFSQENKPLVSFVPHGQGGVVFMRPFDFEDKRYDGELLRWKLTYYLLNKMYLKEHITPALIPAVKTIKHNIAQQKLQKNEKIIMSNLQFELNSYKLKKNNYTLLKPIIFYLKENPQTNLIISGYTDDIGSRTYNNRLSKNRAKNIQKILVTMGIKKDRVIPKGYGSSFPLATNKTLEGRALNRRVEFTIVDR